MSDENLRENIPTDDHKPEEILDNSELEATEEFTTYRSFNSEHVASLLAQLLDENAIEYQLLGDGSRMPEIVGHNVVSYSIELKPSDFGKVDELIEKRSNAELDSVDPDYFIFSYSDDELIDILRNAAEWSPLDVALAQKILKERGNPVSPEQIVSWREERLEESRKAKSLKSSTRIFTYVVAIFFPIIGVIMGSVYAFAKKKDAMGFSTPSYDERSRTHGKRIAILALIVAIAAITIGYLIGPR